MLIFLIIISFLIGFFHVEIIDYLGELLKPRPVAEQWSKEEREILDKQGKPPLKINLIKKEVNHEK